MSCRKFPQKERKRKQKGAAAAVLLFLAFSLALFLNGCSRAPTGFRQEDKKETEAAAASSELSAEGISTVSYSSSDPADDNDSQSFEEFVFPEYVGEPFIILNDNVPDF